MMRLILAAATLTALALPAYAQRLDTRRIDVRETASGTTCSFNAYRELTLLHGPPGDPNKIAIWRKAPEGAAPGERARLQLAFQPAGSGEGAWRRPPILNLEFQAYPDGILPRNAVAHARLVIDGEPPIPLLYTVDGDALIFSVGINLPATGHRLLESGSKKAEIILLGLGGNVVRRYTVDISRLADAVETVSVVGWSCTTP